LILKGKYAIVTGGSRGIGKAIAQALYNEGAVVYIVSRNLEELEKTAKTLDSRKDDSVKPISFDVSDAIAVKEAFKKIAAEQGDIHIVVNCAGINLRGPIEDLPEENWDKMLNINLKSAFLVSQAALPMLKKQGGKILNICSMMSAVARPNVAPYAASKGGLKQFTKALAVEWAPHNIQVNGIEPGFITTEMTIPLRQDEKFNAFIIKRTPAGRWGEPEDIASAALFLCSPSADFITGQILAVDGGILASL
jgi:gluconate 5-dehydrogenase